MAGELASKLGHENDDDDGASDGAGSGGAAATEPTWEEFWPDKD